MQKRSYWLDLFTGTTWKEFLAAGGQVSGFRESRWKSMQKMRPGDYLLCYLTGLSRWVGMLEVLSAPFIDETPIWKDESFPCRVKVKPVITLTPETAVPVIELREQLTVFRGLKNPAAWSGAFRGSPVQWKTGDGEVILEALTRSAYRTNPHGFINPLRFARNVQPKPGVVGFSFFLDTAILTRPARHANPPSLVWNRRRNYVTTASYEVGVLRIGRQGTPRD